LPVALGGNAKLKGAEYRSSCSEEKQARLRGDRRKAFPIADLQRKPVFQRHVRHVASKPTIKGCRHHVGGFVAGRGWVKGAAYAAQQFRKMAQFPRAPRPMAAARDRSGRRCLE